VRRGIPAVAVLLIGAAALVAGPVALAGYDSIRDRKGDTKALKAKPEIDIARVSAADEVGGRVKFKITMHGRLEPEKKNTRPFILINTKGGGVSEFEYLVLGPRVFKAVGKKYVKVGANKFIARRSTWIYRWKPASIGLADGEEFGWAILTAKGNTVDLAPADRYRDFEIETIPSP
jgi:hypothetical protein